jgi:hypothetical protein
VVERKLQAFTGRRRPSCDTLSTERSTVVLWSLWFCATHAYVQWAISVSSRFSGVFIAFLSTSQQEELENAIKKTQQLAGNSIGGWWLIFLIYVIDIKQYIQLKNILSSAPNPQAPSDSQNPKRAPALTSYFILIPVLLILTSYFIRHRSPRSFFGVGVATYDLRRRSAGPWPFGALSWRRTSHCHCHCHTHVCQARDLAGCLVGPG